MKNRQIRSDREAWEVVERIAREEIRERRIRSVLDSFAIAVISIAAALSYTENPIIMWFYFAFVAVFLGLGVWDIAKVLRERGE